MRKTAKKILIALSLSAAVLCMAGGISACEVDLSKYPDYKLFGIQEETDATDKYIINTLSLGGIKLAGVKVTASQNGQPVRSGRSNEKGQISFSLPAGVYSLEFEDLPDGYDAETATVRTTPDSYGVVDVRFSSKVISTAASSDMKYALGDVMHDFRFSDSRGNDYRLSDLLAGKEEGGKGYKAVVLNFWYTTCGPCMSEIPAMQKAYESYNSKAALLALSNQDDNDSINRFMKNLETTITFPMGYDSKGLYKNFGVTQYPTTVVIDRYGAVVQVEAGALPSVSSWVELFSSYTSDNYTQDVTVGEDPSEGEVFVPDLVNIPEPDYNDIKNALVDTESSRANDITFHGETVAKDIPYCWPWLKKSDADNTYAEASNKGKRGSFSNLYCTVNIKNNEVLSIDYSISIRSDFDYFYILIKESGGSFRVVEELTGNSDGWKNVTLYRSNKDQTIEVAFCYQRAVIVTDSENYTDTARISNLVLRDAESSEIPTDIIRNAAVQLNAAQTQYIKTVELIDPSNTSDGYYHVVTKTSEPGSPAMESILYADILNPTAWSRLNLRTGGDYFQRPNDGTNVFKSLYELSYWYLSNWEKLSDTNPLVLYSGSDPKYRRASDEIIDNYYMQLFSDNGYVPVSPMLKEAIEVFLEKIGAKLNLQTYENQWLEFCYYFDHYGSIHTGNEHCSQNYDPVKGMSMYNAYETKVSVRYMMDEPNHVNVYRGKNNDSSVRFRFTPTESGTYRIYSKVDYAKDIITDPHFYIVTANGEYIYEEDDCLLYDRFASNESGNYNYGLNFDAYFYFEKDVTMYLYMRLHMPGATGEYDFYVEKVAGEEETKRLIVCTTGEGLFTSKNEDFTDIEYVAIDIAYDASTNLWYSDENGRYGSPIYVDFIHGNFFDKNGHSLKEMVDAGIFNFEKIGGSDNTQLMLEYYARATAQDRVGTELYGLIEADKQLVNIIDYYTSHKFEQPTGTKCWLSMACYYKSFGPNA